MQVQISLVGVDSEASFELDNQTCVSLSPIFLSYFPVAVWASNTVTYTLLPDLPLKGYINPKSGIGLSSLHCLHIIHNGIKFGKNQIKCKEFQRYCASGDVYAVHKEGPPALEKGGRHKTISVL